MKNVFADSFYFFALLNERDASHAKALELSTTFQGRMITTGWILTELGEGLANPRQRSLFVAIYNDLKTQPNIVVVPCSDELLAEGIDLYARRLDKEWSLTDCISFVVMQREGITEALTGDHHFEQAGFIALLK